MFSPNKQNDQQIQDSPTDQENQSQDSANINLQPKDINSQNLVQQPSLDEALTKIIEVFGSGSNYNLYEQIKLQGEKQNSQQAFSREQIEFYINQLNEHFINVEDQLKQEEQAIQNVYNQNIELKQRLSEELLSFENSVVEAKNEIIRLTENNKDFLNQKHHNLETKQMMAGKLQEVTSEHQEIELKVKSLINDLQTQKEDITTEFQQIQKIEENLKIEKSGKDHDEDVSLEIQKLLKQKENQLSEKKKEISDFDMKIEQFDKKIRDTEVEIISLQNEGTKINIDLKQIQKKNAQLDAKQQQQQEILQEMDKEIKQKSDELDLMRNNNSKLEQKVSQLEQFEEQLKQEEIARQLLQMQADQLRKQFESVEEKLPAQVQKQKTMENIKNKTNQNIRKSETLQQSKSKNYNQQQGEDQSLSESKLVELEELQSETQKEKQQMQNLEETLNEKYQNIEEERTLMTKLQMQIKQFEADISNEKKSKMEYLVKYSNLERKMGELSENYIDLQKQINSKSNQKYSSNIKQNAFDIDPEDFEKQFDISGEKKEEMKVAEQKIQQSGAKDSKKQQSGLKQQQFDDDNLETFDEEQGRVQNRLHQSDRLSDDQEAVQIGTEVDESKSVPEQKNYKF